ncbi:MAG TPA: MoaD/ThiS family protein [Candidatus Aenigmarchaeota archaeon]|nr:MoaD/ThiS family protein [Candidatus Aenigmarchaeota archaeon]
MQVKLKFSSRIKKVSAEVKTIEELLKKLKINTESVLVKRNGRFVPIEDEIKNGDEIEVIEITSSG